MWDWPRTGADQVLEEVEKHRCVYSKEKKKKKKGREKEKKDREKERASTFLNRPGLVLGRMTQA